MDSTAPERGVLVVDDDPQIRDLIGSVFRKNGLPCALTGGPEEARAYLAKPEFDVALILLDWEMPGQSGLEFLSELKNNRQYKYIPVMMVTARSAAEDVQAGTRAGAFFYLTKPFDSRILKQLATSAMDAFLAARLRDQPNADIVRPLAVAGRYRFRRLYEARELAAWLALACPDPQGAQLGLFELMVNAIEHGNLGIDYEEKTRLLSEYRLEEEIERRLQLPENQEKFAEVEYKDLGDSFEFHIRDCGEGFDFLRFQSLTVETAYSHHGRGIVIARNLCFDDMQYIGRGNQVRGVILRTRSAR
jgi:CheY-like chemotaxis protein